MNYKSICSVVSIVFFTLAGAMAACAAIGWGMNDPSGSTRALLQAAAINALLGALLRVGSQGRHEVQVRDAIAITVLSWIALGVFGGLPYFLEHRAGGLNAVDAVFESMSGFTTTGASVIPAPEEWSRGILLWRAVTHFIGGMGVLVLCVAILPLLGGGGMQMFRAEMPGPIKDRFTPRIADTARILWFVYVGITAVGAVALRVAGTSWFDAVCHSMAAVATGGFSTYGNSVAHFNSLPVEMVLLALMFMGGMNFSLHYAFFTGRDWKAYIRDSEFRYYLFFMAGASLLVAIDLCVVEGRSLFASLRAGAFSVVSVGTTTGFATDDFDRWPAFSKGILLVAMLLGGCSGSTAGAIKHFRAWVSVKDFHLKLKAFFNPMAVMKVKMNGVPISLPIVSGIVSFVTFYLIFVIAASLAMCLYMDDGMAALTSVMATTGCVGPGLGPVGPMVNYAWIPDGGKWILIGCMLVGRLEFYAVLAMLLPSFWKR